MNGFDAQKQFRQDRLTGQQSIAVTLTCIAVALSLCLTSGCAMTRKAWSGLHDATCGETASQCSCNCGKGISDAHVEHEAGYQIAPDDPSRAASPTQAATPSPLERVRPIEHGIRPQAATMNGMPGTWTPSPPMTHFEAADPNSASADNPTSGWPEAESVTTGPPSMRYCPPTAVQTQWPPMPAQPMYPQDTASENDDLKECRTQVQILAEQISQMKLAQESMKESQEMRQQSHEREILELKLQQTTADRDRLEREHELEQELEKQRRRELETIDSLSQIIDDVVPAPAVPNAAFRQVPRPKSKSGPVRPMLPQNLPTVDESL
ncbi:MAG: hypothetical protein WKF77_19685 [Planctomycetaceae bacterium]